MTHRVTITLKGENDELDLALQAARAMLDMPDSKVCGFGYGPPELRVYFSAHRTRTGAIVVVQENGT